MESAELKLTVKPSTRRWLRKQAGGPRKIGRWLDSISDAAMLGVNVVGGIIVPDRKSISEINCSEKQSTG